MTPEHWDPIESVSPSNHALQRMYERLGVYKKVARKWLREEVLRASRDGAISQYAPGWALYNKHAGRDAGWVLAVWKTTPVAILVKRDVEPEVRYTVVTVVTP